MMNRKNTDWLKILWGICIGIVGGHSSLYAQGPMFYPQTHEVGIRVGSFHSQPALADAYQEGAGELEWANGLQYKFHWDLYNVFRLTVGRRKSLFDAAFEGTDPDQFRTEKVDWDVRLGYEGNMPIGPITLLGGLEGVYNNANLVQEKLASQSQEIMATDELSYSAWGANAFGGLRLFFSPYISTAIEGNVTYLKSDAHQLLGVYDSELSDNEWNVELNLYLSFHFVKLKKRCACGG